ncbi:hypothetical protein HOK31_26065, partial [Candidatus Poribacteria bacterium]|nr:hypothetical protein [Candidatus Poribacteria bacterium]
KNAAHNWNAKRRAFPTDLLPDMPDTGASPLERLEDEERWEALIRALTRLDKRHQDVLQAAYLQELGPAAMKARYGLSSAAIAMRLGRARRALRRQLGVAAGLLAWFTWRPKARAFGEVPVGSGRMSTTFSLMTSTLIVGWLGITAHSIEQAPVDLAMISPDGDTAMRIAQLDRMSAEFRPRVTLISGGVTSGEEGRMSKVLDIAPTHPYTTSVAGLERMLQAGGQSEWSPTRLQGVLGHAFSFVMREGAGTVFQEAYLDYRGGDAHFIEMLPDLGLRIQSFQATRQDEEDDWNQLKVDAWTAVRASIDRGIPAMAWNPMSHQQEEDGLSAQLWGLIVGYDESDETYTVRHQFVGDGAEAFTVRYDALGHSGQSWFCVLVCDAVDQVDAASVHANTLRNAVGLANGTRFGPQDIGYRVDATGFAAYELWGEALASGAAPAKKSGRHAWELRIAREHAAAYLRELVDVFADATPELQEAATHYDREVETLRELEHLSGVAEEAGGFTEDTGAEARDLLTAALQADRDAITKVAAAIAVFEASR